MESNNKVFWLDNLRILATIAVVILHVSTSVTNSYGEISYSNWFIANIFNSSTRFCVPVFLMITGSLLLPKEYSIKDFLKKRVIRIVIPFAFWGIIYLLFSLAIKIGGGDKGTFFENIKFIYKSIQDGIFPHFWYLFMIVGIYLFIPIIGKWVRNSSEKELEYFLSIWIITILINQPYLLKYKIDFYLNYFSGYIGYVILGHYLTVRTNFKKAVEIKLAAFLLVLGIAITVLGTYYSLAYFNIKSMLFYEYLTPNVLMASIGVFILFKNLNMNFLSKKLSIISKYSFGIYFVHVLIRIVLNKFGLNGEFINSFIGILLTSFACISISTIIIFCINKLPYGKYVAG